jgi:GTP-binding protein
MKFLDSAKIYIKAGNGGKGSVAFRREKFIEFGGPSGGNGGKGGDIYFEATRNLNTLIDFRYKQHFMAKNGHAGMGKSKSGEDGNDIVITVPVGTVVYNEDKSEVLFDLAEDGQKVLFLNGGIGGKGNEFFKSSTNRSPRFSQPGMPGNELWVWLELELIADCGIIGLPNAGKSTLINSLTNSKYKTANYAFTTLQPNLGVLEIYDKQIVFADLPGLIEGASEGIGLGFKFLSHIKRTRSFLHVLDASSEKIAKDYKTVINELEQYQADLLEKHEVIVLNKIDLIDAKTLASQIKKLQKITNHPIVCICAVTKEGLEDLVKQVYNYFYPKIEN